MVEPRSPSTILVVEDQDSIGSVLADVLHDEGYAVTCVSDGQRALHHLRDNPAPGLIILDLNMPVMDGREFLVRRDDNPALLEIPVIVISADRRHAQSYGERHAAAYLVKPFKLSHLLELVERHCVQQTSR